MQTHSRAFKSDVSKVLRVCRQTCVLFSLTKLFTLPGFLLPSQPGIESVSMLWGQDYSLQEELVWVSEPLSWLLMLLLSHFLSAMSLICLVGPQDNSSSPMPALVPQALHQHTNSCLTSYSAFLKTVQKFTVVLIVCCFNKSGLCESQQVAVGSLEALINHRRLEQSPNGGSS